MKRNAITFKNFSLSRLNSFEKGSINVEISRGTNQTNKYTEKKEEKKYQQKFVPYIHLNVVDINIVSHT